MQRIDGRAFDQIRPVSFELGIAPNATGSVLVAMGNTRVICGVMIEEGVPRWMKEQGVAGGWLTAEYSMLPYSTNTRKPRDIARARLDGRSSEIQRLIGRSLRAVVDLEKLGPRTMWVDCDVLQADGGTRTAAITGASLAVAMACRKLVDEKKLTRHRRSGNWSPRSASAWSTEMPVLDLNYVEDKAVTVDFNMVVTEDGEFVELQGSGEEATFSQEQLAEMLALGRKGIAELIDAQRAAIDACRLDQLPPPAVSETSREKSAHHRHHRPGRLLPRRSAARERLRSPRHHPPREHLQHVAHRSSLRGSARQRRPPLPALRRSDRLAESGEAALSN